MKRFLIPLVLLICSASAIIVELHGVERRSLPILGEFKVNWTNDTLFYIVPEPKLIASDDTGEEFNKQGISIVNFFFTKCPSICPITTYQFKRVNNALSSEKTVFINSVSIDTANDTKQVLNDYKKSQNIESYHWTFYTGSKKNIYEFARNCKIKAFEEAKDTEIIHEPVVVLLDKEKRVRGYYNSTKTDDMDLLIRDAKILIKEQL